MRRVRTGVHVADAMTTRPITIRPDASLQEAAHVMHDQNVGSLVVEVDGKLMGILTEWDLVHKAILCALDVETTPVALAMTRDLVTIAPQGDILDALLLMRDADVRHLPVMEDGRFRGFITLKDILRLQPNLIEWIVDKFELREAERKLFDHEEEYHEEGF